MICIRENGTFKLPFSSEIFLFVQSTLFYLRDLYAPLAQSILGINPFFLYNKMSHGTSMGEILNEIRQ